MRHPRQEGHHHAQGHPARQEDPWRESLNVLSNQIPEKYKMAFLRPKIFSREINFKKINVVIILFEENESCEHDSTPESSIADEFVMVPIDLEVTGAGGS